MDPQNKTLENKDSEKSQYTPNPDLKTLRTYQGDVEAAIGAKKSSIVSIAVAEQEAAPKKNLAHFDAEPQKQVGPARKGESLIQKLFNVSVIPLTGIISVVVGALVLFGAYYFIHSRTEPLPVATNQTLIVQTNTDNVTIHNTTSVQSQIMTKLAADLKSFNGPAGAILSVRFIDASAGQSSPLSENNFFQNIALGAPDTLIRSMTGNYIAGIYSFSTNQAFLLLSTEDYGQAYAGMLQWEAVMPADLSPIFPLGVDQNSASTTTWGDDTFDNRDVRILRNIDGAITLVYGFLDDNTVLITGNEDVFQAIANKYLDAKLVH